MMLSAKREWDDSVRLRRCQKRAASRNTIAQATATVAAALIA